MQISLQCKTVTIEILATIGILLFFFKFLWNDKKDKIKRKRSTQNYENDGLRKSS